MKYLASLLLVICTCVVSAQDTISPMSISMEGYDYPYRVSLFPLTIEGQQLRMAYMDVAATTAATGQTIVLLHGKNFGSYYWGKTIAALTQKGYRVIAIDQIGFGRSSKAVIHYSLHLLAYNTHLLLDSLHISRPILLGHSTGGMLAARYAIMYPAQVMALILEDPIGLEDYRLLEPYTTPDSLYQEELSSTDEATLKYIKSYFSTWQPAYGIYARIMNAWKRSAEYPRMARVAAMTTEMIYEQPVCYEWGRITAPALIIAGEDDRTVVGKAKVPKELLPTAGLFPQMAARAAGQMQEGSYVLIPHTGHIPHIESTADFHLQLFKFLDGIK